MQTKRLFIWLSLVALVIVLVAAPLDAASAGPASKPRFCQCVDYIKNRYGLTGAIGGSGGAKDMGPYLVARGFVQVASPQVGAIVIFQPSFGKGIDQTYGHVGVITRVQSVNKDRQWSITVRGANQGGRLFTENNCTNVSDVPYKSYPKGSTSLSYWVRR